MSYIEFDASLMVGNRLIDQEHEVLISYINLLQRALDNEASASLIEKVLSGLVEYTKTHFFLEEELMQAYGYPNYDAHKNAHEGFKKTANDLLTQFENGVDIDLNEVNEFLKEWLIGHILKLDVVLAEFLKGKTL
ncbi:MAG: bacteriohemerythrin [Gammaproteobacteria bacterium]|nr:bacteriohemerythrin [Gammaproteobacteria bacterium]